MKNKKRTGLFNFSNLFTDLESKLFIHNAEPTKAYSRDTSITPKPTKIGSICFENKLNIKSSPPPSNLLRKTSRLKAKFNNLPAVLHPCCNLQTFVTCNKSLENNFFALRFPRKILKF